MTNVLKLQSQECPPNSIQNWLCPSIQAILWVCLVSTVTWFELYYHKCLNKADYKSTCMPGCASSQLKNGNATTWLYGALWSSWNQVAHPEYLHTGSIQPCKYVYKSAKSSVSHFYLLLGVKLHAHIPREVSLVNKTLWKKKSCYSIFCSCENNVIQLLEKSQLQLYCKAVAIHRYCMKRVCIFLDESLI